VLEQLAVAERHVNPDVLVFRACFQQQHGIPAGGSETIGKNASCGSCTDNDVIEFPGFGRSRSSGCRLTVHVFPSGVSADTKKRNCAKSKRRDEIATETAATDWQLRFHAA